MHVRLRMLRLPQRQARNEYGVRLKDGNLSSGVIPYISTVLPLCPFFHLFISIYSILLILFVSRAVSDMGACSEAMAAKLGPDFAKLVAAEKGKEFLGTKVAEIKNIMGERGDQIKADALKLVDEKEE